MDITSKHIKTYIEERDKYPALSKAAEVMSPPPADILGRDLNELRRGLRNPEKANVALLAEPGTGKTAYVQGFAYDKDSLPYYLVLDVNPERLIEKTGDRDNALLTGFNELLDQAGNYSKEHDVIVVLFVDEFHKMMAISPSLMESLKPRLEKSALHGFRLIAATTFQEYNETIAQNRALDQRFLQIKLTELPKDAVIHVLENRAKQHGVLDLLDKGVLEDIYLESKRILMSNAQPRASIDILNSMIGDTVKGEHMENGKLVKEFFTPAELGFAGDKVLSRPLLKRIIRRSYGIDIDNSVNVTTVIDALKNRLFNQDNAIEVVVHLLEMAAHGFSDPTRPKFSFLSTGSTGVGKSLRDDELIPAPVPEGYIRNGDLKPGNYVYGKHGKKIRVSSVHPQGMRTVYRMTLADGRQIDCAGDHLWTFRDRTMKGNVSKCPWETDTTKSILARGVLKRKPSGQEVYRFEIPQNQAVEREEVSLKLNPYVLGALIGSGVLTVKHCRITTGKEEVAARIGQFLDAPVKQQGRSYAPIKSFWDGHDKLFQMQDLLCEVPELIGLKSADRFIPDLYKYGSISQRRLLIQGLFDTNGNIMHNKNLNVMYCTASKRLAYDIQEVLWSLGIMSNIKDRTNGSGIIYTVRVRGSKETKRGLFSIESQIQKVGLGTCRPKQRNKRYDAVAIRSIEKLDYKEPMTCIMVDDPEHLYLAGREHIVTHNTEMAKIITESMMIPLKRFDMSRYSDPKMAKDFADALFQAAWSTPNAYLLIDEVEKSSKRAMNILLQVLDDARLTDSANQDRVASFAGCIINLTTNVGSEIYQNMNKFQSSDTEADVELVYKALCNAVDSDGKPLFETAVLGRVDEIVPFHPLPASAMEKIARKALMEAVETAQTRDRRILISDDIIPYIVKDRTSSDTERGGARDAKRNVRNIVVQQLAHYLTYTEKEVPVILYLKGRPRFKHADVADPLNAHVELMECYPASAAETILNQFKEKLGKPFINKGLFFPANKPLQCYAQELAKLISSGCFQFYTHVDGEDVTIKGV